MSGISMSTGVRRSEEVRALIERTVNDFGRLGVFYKMPACSGD
jgi:hypothetical protein